MKYMQFISGYYSQKQMIMDQRINCGWNKRCLSFYFNIIRILSFDHNVWINFRFGFTNILLYFTIDAALHDSSEKLAKQTEQAVNNTQEVSSSVTDTKPPVAPQLTAPGSTSSYQRTPGQILSLTSNIDFSMDTDSPEYRRRANCIGKLCSW